MAAALCVASLVLLAPASAAVNAYLKLPLSWRGTVTLPDGSRRLAGSFSELPTGDGYSLELEGGDTGVVLRLGGASVSGPVDLDLSRLSALRRGGEGFVGVDADAWAALQAQLRPREVAASFPREAERIYSCERADPSACGKEGWAECAGCERSGGGWKLPGPGSYGTAPDSRERLDVVEEADALLRWKDLLAAALGVGAVVLAGLRLAKRRTVGEERVEVAREIGLESGQVKLTVTVVNGSTFPIREAEVHLEVPEHLAVREPAALPLQLGDISAGERMSAVFRLLPIRRVTGTIRGRVTYIGRGEGRTSVAVADVPVPCLCSFMVKAELPEAEFDEKAAHMERATRRRRSARGADALVEGLRARCGVLQPVAERWESPDEWVGKYFARERTSNREFGLVVRYQRGGAGGGAEAGDGRGAVDVTAFGESHGTITGLADEIALFLDFEEGGGGTARAGAAGPPSGAKA